MWILEFKFECCTKITHILTVSQGTSIFIIQHIVTIQTETYDVYSKYKTKPIARDFQIYDQGLTKGCSFNFMYSRN